MTLDEFFAGQAASRGLFDALVAATAVVGDVETRATKSQVAFCRRRAFAWAWIPGRYLRGERPPLVLSVALSRRDGSPRWRQVVEPAPGRFMHHLELRSSADIDAEVVAWLREAADAVAARVDS